MKVPILLLIEAFGSRTITDYSESHNSTGAIAVELKFRTDAKSPLVTYLLEINEQDEHPIIEKETFQYRRGKTGQPWRFLDFSQGKGMAVMNELDIVIDIKALKREEYTLKAPDILALKGLAQFEKFPVAKAKD